MLSSDQWQHRAGLHTLRAATNKRRHPLIAAMTTAKNKSRKAFLIDDDEPLARMELTPIVQDRGYEDREASNIVEALSISEADGEPFMGLITDINMPGTRSRIVLANHVRCMWPH